MENGGHDDDEEVTAPLHDHAELVPSDSDDAGQTASDDDSNGDEISEDESMNETPVVATECPGPGEYDYDDGRWVNGCHPDHPETWPDNQLGAPPFLLPAPSPESPESETEHDPEPETSEQKLQKFWKRFVVPWPKPEEPEEEPHESEAESEKETGDIDVDVPEPICDQSDNESGSHVSSETLELPGVEPDSESEDFQPVVSMDEFAEAMGVGASAAHQGSLAAASSKATLETPPCSRPGFWGFPLVDTPPKVSVPRPKGDVDLLIYCGTMLFDLL